MMPTPGAPVSADGAEVVLGAGVQARRAPMDVYVLVYAVADTAFQEVSVLTPQASSSHHWVVAGPRIVEA